MKRDYPAWVIAFAALALTIPLAPAHSTMLVVGMCSGETRTMVLPLDPAEPSKENGSGCCGKACHAGNDRRKRGEGIIPPCC
jgi:hypothetical protein